MSRARPPLVGKSVLPAPRPIVGSNQAKADMQAWNDYFLKAATVASVGTIGAKYSVLPEANVELFGRQVSVTVAAWAALFAASLIGEWTHDRVLPHISRDDKFLSAAGLLSPAATAAANLVVWSAASMEAVNEKGALSILAIGAGAEVAGDWLYTKVLSPWIHAM